MRLRATLALLAASLLAGPAAAQEGDGRLRGDLTFEVSLGGGATFEGPTVSGAGTAELRARYLDTAGLVLGAEWRAEGASRVLIMVDLRPLFVPRFFLGAQVGDRYWDVFIDSIGIDLGVALGPLDERFGAAFAVGFGFDVPLVFFSDHGYEGLGLRLYGRHVAAQPTDLYGPNGGLNDWIVGGLLVLRLQAQTGLPAWEPQRYRHRE